MSANRFGPKCAPLRYDPSRAFVPFTTVSRTELIALHDRLEIARRKLLSNSESEEPSDTAFVDLPEQMLTDYRESRGRSALGQILATGKRLRDTVDRVVVLTSGAAEFGASALFDAGCHPYHNELSRGDRGGRPRIYFVDDGVDNDATQGLLDLLCHGHRAAKVDERWAIIVIDEGGGAIDKSPLQHCLLTALSDSCGGDLDAVADLFLPIRDSAGCDTVLSVAGLLPAAVMGLDIVRLLQGAAMMNERFRDAPPGDNPVLDYAGVSHLMEKVHGANSADLVPWFNALEPAVRWRESLPFERDDGPHESQRIGGLVTNLIVDSVRRDRLVIPLADVDGENGSVPFAESSHTSFPEIQSIMVQQANDAHAEQRRPTADLHLPAIDESSLGQFFQLMMLTTSIESRLRVRQSSKPSTLGDHSWPSK